MDHAYKVSRESEFIWVQYGGGLQFWEVFRGFFYEIMSFVSSGALGRSHHFTNFSLLSRFDLTRRRGPKIIISGPKDLTVIIPQI